MEKPIIVERFADNGAHSHWEVVDPSNGASIWSEDEDNPDYVKAKKWDDALDRLSAIYYGDTLETEANFDEEDAGDWIIKLRDEVEKIFEFD